MSLLKRKKNDAELMNLVKEGSDHAFEILYDRYKLRLYNFILRFIGDEALAEDIFQEAFLRLFKNREFWNPEAHFSTYLYKIARNIYLDHLKKSSTRHETLFTEKIHSEEREEIAFEKIEDAKLDPLEILEEKERLQALENSLFSLPPDLKEVIIFSRYEGLKYEQIAEITNTSLSAVKQKARRGISILKEKLKNFL